jgi:hypothetical protein
MQSTAWICGHSLAGIVGLNSVSGTDDCAGTRPSDGPIPHPQNTTKCMSLNATITSTPTMSGRKRVRQFIDPKIN